MGCGGSTKTVVLPAKLRGRSLGGRVLVPWYRDSTHCPLPFLIEHEHEGLSAGGEHVLL